MPRRVSALGSSFIAARATPAKRRAAPPTAAAVAQPAAACDRDRIVPAPCQQVRSVRVVQGSSQCHGRQKLTCSRAACTHKDGPPGPSSCAGSLSQLSGPCHSIHAEVCACDSSEVGSVLDGLRAERHRHSNDGGKHQRVPDAQDRRTGPVKSSSGSGVRPRGPAALASR